MEKGQSSSEGLSKLAAEVVRIIMQDESLAAELGNGLLVLGKQKCPNNNHKCTSPFSCNKPFTCPKVHTVVEPTKKDVG